jgi:hypothetical protein
MSRSFGRVALAAVAGGLAVLAIQTPAVAQGGTPQERAACMTDAMTYCASAIPDEGRIEACLRRQEARISTACRTVLGPSQTPDVVDTASLRRQARP